MPIKSTCFLAFALLSFFSIASAQQPAAGKPEPALDVTSMDRTVDPCVDFFAYSCGGWIKNNPIPPDQSSWDTYSRMQDENVGRLHEILEASAAPDAKRNAVTQKIGDYYASCTDEKAIDAKGAQPLAPELQRIAKIGSKAEIADVAASMISENVLFRFYSSRTTATPVKSSPTRIRADSACPTAITTPKKNRSRSTCVKPTSRTCRKCSSFSATSPKPRPRRRRP